MSEIPMTLPEGFMVRILEILRGHLSFASAICMIPAPG